MAHTPGPWKMTEILDDEGGPPVYRIEAATTLFLTVAPCSDGYVPGQNAANAYLIAAAPDLLAVCEAILPGIESEARCASMWSDRIAAKQKASMLRAAIAKANGSPP